MRSPLQIAASKANGAKSRGPVTEEGKRNSARNAERHRLLCGTLLAEGESTDRFDELYASMLEEFQPETDSELRLLEAMVAAKWRQLRIWAFDTVNLTQEIQSQPREIAGKSPAVRASLAFRSLADHTRSLDVLNRYEVRFERQYHRSLQVLEMKIARRTAKQ
jgi:hypothetical protein